MSDNMQVSSTKGTQEVQAVAVSVATVKDKPLTHVAGNGLDFPAIIESDIRLIPAINESFALLKKQGIKQAVLLFHATYFNDVEGATACKIGNTKGKVLDVTPAFTPSLIRASITQDLLKESVVEGWDTFLSSFGTKEVNSMPANMLVVVYSAQRLNAKGIETYLAWSYLQAWKARATLSRKARDVEKQAPKTTYVRELHGKQEGESTQASKASKPTGASLLKRK